MTIRPLLAGIAGTAVVAGFESWDARLLGRPPVFTPKKIASRLAGRSRAKRLGSLMRWSYGPGWGLVASRLARFQSRLLNGAVIGGSLLGFELVALPASNATPPLRKWGAIPLALLAAQTLAYGLVCAAVLGPAE